MVVNDIYDFDVWFPHAVKIFFKEAGFLSLLAFGLCFLVLAFRYGPLAAGDMIFRFTTTAFVELTRISPRRVWALARLAVQESLRRHVMVALILFGVVLLFAGWFLDNNSPDPSLLYLNFVFSTTTYLAWALAVFISAFSLPADFKNRTIYTVVTKPVRSGEIVLGRILGFTLIGTALLAVMGLASYVFAIRLLNHTHDIELTSLEAVSGESQAGTTGRTSTAHGHYHDLRLDKDGHGSTDLKHGHWHEITAHEEGGKTTYAVSNPQEMFLARVPQYGDLAFKGRTGQGASAGISVGKEWTYRSFVEGGTAAAAIWTFHDVTPERFPNGLPLEMTIRVFRSHKGVIDRGITGNLVVRNPKTGKTSELFQFEAKDDTIDRHDIPVELTDTSGNKLNLFKDLVADGDVEISIQCINPGQYFGMARPDLYLRAANASFELNFIKGYFGIWLQMLLVISFCVMFSSFLSGPVAMLATISVLVIGLFTDDIYKLAHGITQGGGPIESSIRIADGSNMTIEMEDSLTRHVVRAVDWVALGFMDGLASLLPDLSKFQEAFIDPVSQGFDISFDAVAVWSARAVAYLLVVFVVGYFFLKTREVAK